MDRVGLGWRTELAPMIMMHSNQIDVVEVILDDYFSASTNSLRALRTLASQIPTLYHGVGLGLATSFRLNSIKLENLRRVIDYVAPATWSEHLAFVRTGRIEIGHLAAPPRNMETVEATLENLEKIKKTIGICPSLENIATLIDPPHSNMSEGLWTSMILQSSSAPMLLDLHNLYSNAVNFGSNPVEYLKTFPLERVQLVHLSGGEWIDEPKVFQSDGTRQRRLDDHVHDVPEIVFELLDVLARSVRQPLTVIIERDGQYPAFQILLEQIGRAKKILKSAREQRALNAGDFRECANA